MAQTRTTVTNKRTGEKRTYIARLVDEKETEKAIEVLCDCFVAPLPTEDLKECRQIQDLFQRKEELIKRLWKHTKGQVRTIEEAGSPDDVINCTTREELTEYYARAYITQSITDGMCAGIYLEDNRTLVALWLGSSFDPKSFFESEIQVIEGYTVSALLGWMDKKFSDDFLHRPKFAAHRELVNKSPQGKILHWDVGGVAPGHRGFALLDVAQSFGLKLAFDLGYRFVIAECVSPITHYTSSKVGYKAHLPASVVFDKWTYQGTKPFEPLVFRSVIPGGDNAALLMYGVIEDILQTIKQKGEQPSEKKESPLQLQQTQMQINKTKIAHTQVMVAAALIGALVILYRLKQPQNKK